MPQLPLEAELTRRVTTHGRLTFAEFMELALYWPRGGYYRQREAPARDYYTSSSAHPAFGALLALQLEEMWELMGRPSPFVVAEIGAGSGQLARDISGYADHLDPFFHESLCYVAVDRSGDGEAGAAPMPYERVTASRLPFRNVTGCILSNELLDAMPVHRVVGRHGRLREIYVTWRDGQLAEEEEEPSSPAISARLAEEGVTLEGGQRAEVCLELESWARDVAGALSKGFVLTVDYGHKATDLYSLQRREGTLRCYYRHTLSADPYQRVGSQDMTTHVDFTATAALGTRYGLTGQPLHTQALFLHNLGLRTFQRRLVAAGLGQSQRDANRMAMLELARPGGMGDFKVLVQSKNVANPSLTGLVGASRAWEERLANLPLPLLGSDHLRLMEARYPHTAQAGESGWPWG